LRLTKAKVILAQFGVLSGIRLLCSEVARRLFDPFLISSYSQTGEDRILSAMLAEIVGGFYVDVGCNHPQRWSNTFSLYKNGWTGINIDANEELIRAHQKLRRKDISICAAVSDKEQDVEFTDFQNSCVSSLCSEHVAAWKKSTTVIGVRSVRTKPLKAILESHSVPSRFDLLCIDVEGHDFEVLTSLDLGFFRPKFIMIEMHGYSMADNNRGRIYEYLIAQGYRMIGFVLMNGYFQDDLAG
jgi:FkbM family methyltransferase